MTSCLLRAPDGYVQETTYRFARSRFSQMGRTKKFRIDVPSLNGCAVNWVKLTGRKRRQSSPIVESRAEFIAGFLSSRLSPQCADKADMRQISLHQL